MDRDSSGYIDREELAFMLKTLGHSPSEAEITEMLVRVPTESMLFHLLHTSQHLILWLLDMRC